MTTGSVPVPEEPRRLLAEVRSLTRRVRRDQRLTWVTLMILAGVTFFVPQQVIDGTVLLLGAIGFGLADRRRR
jgi:arginine exporter protein ArgO